MDLEGFARRSILKGKSENEIISELEKAIKEFKKWEADKRHLFAKAVYDEVQTTLQYKGLKDEFLKDLIAFPKANVDMGEFGVGSRGEGDFFVHRKLSEIIGETGAVVDATQQDDAGVVAAKGDFVTVAVDGIHSRLSEFPFLGGFHVARAALRDVYVMGSKPVALISDLHLADDGDIGKIFDFTAGVSSIADLTGTPLVAGSTLRVGGDMVFGDRLVSAVGAVGISDKKPKARKNAEEGDIILMTEGRGGGTITTIALYHGYFDAIKLTLNVEFMDCCDSLIKKGLLKHVHAMTDVTNGGLRGDAIEISKTANKQLIFTEESLRKTVHPQILKLLEDLKIDYLGISTDSLMIILPEDHVNDVKKSLKRVTKVHEVGCVEAGDGVKMVSEREYELKPLFRESAYTKVKGVVGEIEPEDMREKMGSLEDAKSKAIKKKDKIVDFIRRS
ncbi:MAG: AIR synthase-related protein [Candidatus Hydrothermarchaeales archaeon]